MIDKATALGLSGKRGKVLHHVSKTNADGSPLRARVNGTVKVWAREPARFQLPMKHGLRTCFYITEANAAEWVVPE